MNWALIAVIVSLLGFAVAGYLYKWVNSQPKGNEAIEEIGQLIKEGAAAFLRREYSVLAKFVAVVAILIVLFLPQPIWSGGDPLRNVLTAVAYILGSALSAFAGKVGIKVATIANVKAAVAAKEGIAPAFSVGFRGGAVMGMAVVGTSLFGAGALFLLTKDPTVLLGFSFGASSLALFAKGRRRHIYKNR